MKKLLNATIKTSSITNWTGGAILVVMMLLTVIDVVLRYLGMPMTGTYELMSFCGALVAGFAIAQTSLDGGHVNVNMLTQILDPDRRREVEVFTRLVGIGIFALLAWALFLKGSDLYRTKEVSLTLHFPYYPAAYGLSFCCCVECLVLFYGIVKTVRRGE